MYQRLRIFLICLLSLVMLVSGAVAEEAALSLSSLPSPHLDTALRLDAGLNDQFLTLDTAAEAAEAFARASQLHVGAEEANAQAVAEEGAAEAVVQAAQAAVAEERELLEQLTAMRALHKSMENAEAAYALAMAQEQAADTALDAALEDVSSANGLLEETIADQQSKQAELDELTAQLDGLKEKIKTAGDGEKATLEADLAAGQQAFDVLQARLQQLAEEVGICMLQAEQAEAAQVEAETAQQEAVNALENASNLAELAKGQWETVQLTIEEIDQAEAEAKTALLKAETDFAQAEAALAGAQALAKEKAARLEEAVANLAEATALNDQAQAAKDALEARWAEYADIPGMVLPGAQRMPAMDVIAAADMEIPVYVIHSYGHDLYFFLGGELLDSVQRRERDLQVDVTLTVAQTGKVALRYIHASGQTKMESLAKDATVLFTGEYDVLRLSDMLGPNAVYLGCACDVNTVEIPPVLTVVHLTQEEPIRHLSQGRVGK